MRKILKARKGGFTLVELLIVITIIGVLASMMMMSTGAATDTANAAKLVADATLVGTAAVMYFSDYGEWPDPDDDGVELSLDFYMNKDMFSSGTNGTGTSHPYELAITSGDDGTAYREFIGITSRKDIPQSVQNKLASGANVTGIFGDNRQPYGTGTDPNTILVGLTKSVSRQ